MKGLRGKRAIVTGAGAGIGRATAVRLAAEGVSVGVMDRDAAGAEETVQMITHGGGIGTALACDLSVPDQVQESVSTAASTWRGLDLVVNNAGIAVPGSAIDLSLGDWERMVAVNLRAAWLMIRFTVPHLQRAGGGSIVNVSSLQGVLGFAGWAGYASTKAGLLGLTRQSAVEFAKDRIRVNVVAPGTIATRMNETIINQAPNPAAVTRTWNSLHALGRIGQPVEVASVIAFLLSEESSFVTGACLPVDGGASILGSTDASH